jgi:hypothetical protein
MINYNLVMLFYPQPVILSISISFLQTVKVYEFNELSISNMV